jgi:hypothetical protein
MLLNHVSVLQVAGFMKWRLQQLRSEGSENPAQVLSTARNAIRRVRMVMRGLPQRELTEEGKRLVGSIQHEAAEATKQARLRCAAAAEAAAAELDCMHYIRLCLCPAVDHCLRSAAARTAGPRATC